MGVSRSTASSPGQLDALNMRISRSRRKLYGPRSRAELSPPTFCTFAREFSAFTARGCSWAWAASDPGDRFGRALERPHGPVLPAVASKTHGPAWPAVAGDGQQSVFMRLCRVMDTSRRPPTCWPERGPVVRRPRLTSGPRGPYLPCRSTSRPASARETPNPEARGCVSRRRTPRVDGR